MRNAVHLALVLATCLAGTPALAQTDSTTRSVRDGVFTAEQARAGERVFTRVCLECHEPLEFTDGYLESWDGASVWGLWDYIVNNMPEDSPGRLRPREYAAVIAYIFHLNGLPAGPTELPAEGAPLHNILIRSASQHP